MPALSRTDNSVVGRWWWTVDKSTLLALLVLATAGMMMTMSASPSVAVKLELNPQYFIVRHAMFLPLALLCFVSGVIAIVGGIAAFNRRRWGLAVAGSIAAVFGFFPVGIAAVIFTILAEPEFRASA